MANRSAPPASVVSRLAQFNQMHLLACWDDLEIDEREQLVQTLNAIDFRTLQELYRSFEGLEDRELGDLEPPTLIERSKAPAAIERDQQATRIGQEILSTGRVAVLVVAGGQGTRLGFEHPKGMFPIGPVSGASLYRILSEQVLARVRRAGTDIPLLLMTSEQTDAPTRDHFEQNGYFGLNPESVHFFKQGTMPAMEAKTGRLFLSSPTTIAHSPDGHGGVLAALDRSGLLESLQSRGVRHLYYLQVDNPTAIVADPLLIGHHVQANAEASVKIVPKAFASERMGVVVQRDGCLDVVEYSDLPEELAEEIDSDGQIRYRAGNTAIHIFDLPFLERVLENELPWHRALKRVPHISVGGDLVNPAEPNGYKWERFIFDVLPMARRSIVLEADREVEFNPVKQAIGHNSPEEVRAAMTRQSRRWLSEAGAIVPKDAVVEMSPLYALDAQDVIDRVPPGTRIASRMYFGPDIAGESSATA